MYSFALPAGQIAAADAADLDADNHHARAYGRHGLLLDFDLSRLCEYCYPHLPN